MDVDRAAPWIPAWIPVAGYHVAMATRLATCHWQPAAHAAPAVSLLRTIPRPQFCDLPVKLHHTRSKPLICDPLKVGRKFATADEYRTQWAPAGWRRETLPPPFSLWLARRAATRRGRCWCHDRSRYGLPAARSREASRGFERLFLARHDAELDVPAGLAEIPACLGQLPAVGCARRRSSRPGRVRL